MDFEFIFSFGGKLLDAITAHGRGDVTAGEAAFYIFAVVCGGAVLAVDAWFDRLEAGSSPSSEPDVSAESAPTRSSTGDDGYDTVFRDNFEPTPTLEDVVSAAKQNQDGGGGE